MKKIAAFIMAAAVAVSSSGCSGLSIFSNYREIEDLELIRTIGVDSDPQGVNVIISSGSTGSESAPRIYETQAPAVGVGLAVLQKVPLGKQAILSHTENMVLGEEEARAGIGQVLDYVERYAEMRIDTSLFIVKGGTARDLIQGTAGKNTSAADTYREEVDSLEAKLDKAARNAPRERQAHAIANSVVKAKKESNPDMDSKEIKKASQQALEAARAQVGASGRANRIDITPKEWEAIQAGAISDAKLTQILRYADSAKVREYATPKTYNTLSSAKLSRAKAMKASGYTIQEIADALGVSRSTVTKQLNG